MKILILGDTGHAALGRQLYNSYKKQGHEVNMYSPRQLTNFYLLKVNEGNPHAIPKDGATPDEFNAQVKKYDVDLNPEYFLMKKGVKISELMKYKLIKEQIAELIIVVQQNNTIVVNDTDIPVAYMHIDLGKQPFIVNPSILILNRYTLEEYYKRYWSSMWKKCGDNRYRTLPAINPEEFTLGKKTIKKPVWIARPSPLMQKLDNESLWNSSFDTIVQNLLRRTRKFIHWMRKQPEIKMVEYENKVYEKEKVKGLSRKRYLETMRKARTFISLENQGVYLTRRILEAMVHKTLVLIFCESDKAESYLKECGLEHGVNCYLWRNPKQLLELCHKLETHELEIKPLVKNAYDQ